MDGMARSVTKAGGVRKELKRQDYRCPASASGGRPLCVHRDACCVDRKVPASEGGRDNGENHALHTVAARARASVLLALSVKCSGKYGAWASSFCRSKSLA